MQSLPDILDALEAAAVDLDGTRYVAASRVRRITGLTRPTLRNWRRSGLVYVRYIRVKPGPRTGCGRLALLDLGQTITQVGRWWHRAKKHRWTEADDDFLMTHVGELGIAAVADHIGVSPCAVRKRLHGHGVSLHNIDGFWSIEQVARWLTVSRSAVAYWCDHGLPHQRLPMTQRSRVIDPDRLAGWLRSKRLIFARLSDEAQAKVLHAINKPPFNAGARSRLSSKECAA